MTDTDPDGDELDRLAADFLQAVEAGRNPVPADWLSRHPAHAAGLTAFFADLGRTRGLAPRRRRVIYRRVADHAIGRFLRRPETGCFQSNSVLSPVLGMA